MSLPAVTGVLNEELGIVEPNNTGLWSELTTWDSWNSWSTNSVDELIWLTNVIDLLEPTDFNLEIKTIANGTVTYTVYTSNTGAFAGEETSVEIAADQSDIQAFNGRYVVVAVHVTKTQGVNTLSSVETRATTNVITVRLPSVDSSTLDSDSTARIIDLPRKLSAIKTIEITAHEVAPYALDLYVSSTPTSRQVIPKIVSKDRANPAFTLTGLDNSEQDAVVDIVITGLPEQYMSGSDLKFR